jgi:uncharacterized DUF497 family protein
MDLEFDAAKRDQALLERGLDFARAQEVFEGMHFTGQDSRINYTEDRFWSGPHAAKCAASSA